MLGRLSLAVSIPVLAVLVAVPLRAQDAAGGKKAHAAGKAAKVKPAKVAPHELRPDSNRAAGIHHATHLFESQVLSADGKPVGKVADLVLDPSDGRIQYAVLDASSFMDQKDKLSAVPVDALVGDTVSAAIKLVGIDKAALAAAPGFGKSEWPKDGDRDFVAKVWKQFERKPYWDDKATGFATLRLSPLLKTPLTNAKGEPLGEIENFAVDLVHGKVLYAVVRPSTSMDAGAQGADTKKAADARAEQRVAVPWASVAKGAASGKLVLDMDAAHFATAPAFEADKWPEMSTGTWSTGNDAFYAGTAAAR